MNIVPVARTNNRLVRSSHYGRILREYNDRLARDGIVNEKKFYEEVIAGLVPSYSLNGWYAFIKRFKTETGLVIANTVGSTPDVAPLDGEKKVVKTMLTNQAATVKLVSTLLNISAVAAEQILEHPELMSPKDRAELGLKVMKAQDSRVHAIGKVREDGRAQERFDRALDNAAYGA